MKDFDKKYEEELDEADIEFGDEDSILIDEDILREQ